MKIEFSSSTDANFREKSAIFHHLFQQTQFFIKEWISYVLSGISKRN